MALPVTFVAGDVLEAAQLNSNFTYLEGAGGLTLIKTETIGTTVASVTVTDAFSATYENYKILVSGGASSASNENFSIKLGASTTGYNYQFIYGSYGASVSGAGASNAASFVYAGSQESTNGLIGNIELQNPFLAKYTGIQAQISRSGLGGTCTGLHAVATSYTSFVLTAGSGTLTGGTIYVYGYKKA